jgi:hypothetical protein
MGWRILVDFTCGTFSSNLNIFHEYLMQCPLKFGDTNCHYKRSVAIIRQPVSPTEMGFFPTFTIQVRTATK